MEALVKLSRAVDRWSGSVVVYGTKTSNIVIWGVLDQLVQQNIRLNRELKGGFSGPGLFMVKMEGIGEISVYHEDIFLVALRCDELISREFDALGSAPLARHMMKFIKPIAGEIAAVLDKSISDDEVATIFLDEWSNTLARICIGLRRLGTGGSLLLTPKSTDSLLTVKYGFPYRRLGDSVALLVLDERYARIAWERRMEISSEDVPYAIVMEENLAAADAEDRANEVTAAIKLVTSLASVDGLVLLDPLLHVRGFGVKIMSGTRIGKVYDGPDFLKRFKRARLVDISRFGTRHGSILRYCQSDPDAIGLVVSQDGQVRLIMSIDNTVTLWDNVKLINYDNRVRDLREDAKRRRMLKAMWKPTLGYTSMPKTLQALHRRAKKLRE